MHSLSHEKLKSERIIMKNIKRFAYSKTSHTAPTNPPEEKSLEYLLCYKILHNLCYKILHNFPTQEKRKKLFPNFFSTRMVRFIITI